MTPREFRYRVMAVALVLGLAIGTCVAFATQSDPASTTPTPDPLAAAPQGATLTPPPVDPAAEIPVTPPAGTTPPPAETSVPPPASTPSATPGTSTPETTTPPAAPPPPPPPATSTTTTSTTSTTTTATTQNQATSATIELDRDAASNYNPGGAPEAGIGAAAKAIDGNPLTAWSFKLDRATAGATSVGIVVDLKSARKVGKLKLETTTPGMTVAVYGTSGDVPAAIADPGWVKLADRKSTPAEATLKLGETDRSFRHVLVFVTHAPAGVNVGSVSISELSLATP